MVLVKANIFCSHAFILFSLGQYMQNWSLTGPINQLEVFFSSDYL